MTCVVGATWTTATSTVTGGGPAGESVHVLRAGSQTPAAPAIGNSTFSKKSAGAYSAPATTRAGPDIATIRRSTGTCAVPGPIRTWCPGTVSVRTPLEGSAATPTPSARAASETTNSFAAIVPIGCASPFHTIVARSSARTDEGIPARRKKKPAAKAAARPIGRIFLREMQ